MATDDIRAELDRMSANIFTTEGDVAASEESIDRASKWEDYIGKKQDREQRKEFANKLYRFLIIYMIVVGIFLIMVGFGCIPFALSEAVLLAILGTTTANVISVFVVVAKYLFPTRK